MKIDLCGFTQLSEQTLKYYGVNNTRETTFLLSYCNIIVSFCDPKDLLVLQKYNIQVEQLKQDTFVIIGSIIQFQNIFKNERNDLLSQIKNQFKNSKFGDII
jgi:hypothetical protein